MLSVRRRSLICAVLLLSLAPPRTLGQSAAPQERTPVPTSPGQTTTLLPDGRYLLLGGEQTPGQAIIFDPATGTTRAAGTLQAPRAWHSATVLPDGSVLIAGGRSPDGALVAGAERYDVGRGTGTNLSDLELAPRAGHTATLLTDGRVLFAGGDARGGARAELWDPAANTVTAVPGPPRDDRSNGSARLLADGRVEVAGGTDRAGAPVAAAEIFDPALSSFVSAAGEVPSGALPPHVAAVAPADGARDVLPHARITMRFSEGVDPTSAAGIILSGPAGVVSARLVIAEGGMLAFVTPAAPLIDGEYQVQASGLRTLSRQPVAPFAATFSVSSPRGDAGTDPIDLQGDAERAFNSPWRKLPPLKGRRGVTALAGQVLLLDGQPLPHVTLEIGRRRTRTDRTGRFLLELPGASSGWQELVIEGTTANRPGAEYGIFEVAVQLVGGETAALPYTIWMPRLDTANAVRIDSPTTKEVVITSPHIPGLELHLPRHTVITDHDGKVVREVSITPIPVDRPPFPLPAGVEVPVYFTIQPGGAYLTTHAYGSGRKGPWLVYPNYHGKPPGSRGRFWHYDPAAKGWYVYGMGRVSADGRQAVPDVDVALYEFTGAMFDQEQTPGPDGGNGPRGGDPVDLGTGQFVMEKTDLALQDVIPLALTRTYRTGDGASRPFGLGATHPYAIFLWSANPYQEADLVLPDGKRIHYVRTSAGTGYSNAVFEHTTTPGAFHKSTIVWNGAGWDLTTRDGTVYVFGDAEPLQAIRDRFGNTILLTWDTVNDRVTKVTSPTGRFIEFTYDGFDRITQAKDSIGRTVGYEYDAAGRLWKVTDARGGVTEYSYDIAHRMLTITDPRDIVYLENEYDTAGRVIRQTQADGGEYEFDYTMNGGGQITQTDVTNPRGSVRRVTFNGDGYHTADIAALGEALEQTLTYTRLTGSNLVETETDALGRVTRYTYDSSGNPLSVTSLYGTADAVTTSYTYDATYSLLTSVTDPLNHTSTLGYGSQGQIQSTTNALTHQTTFGTNAAGQVVSVTDALAQTTTLGYALGDLVSVETPLGHTQARFVDGAGRLIRATDPLGAATWFSYDAHDQLTKITDPKGGETAFTYDGNGNLLTLTDARGKTTTWTYDSMDRVATRTDPLNRTESFGYDLNGNLISWTDRKGQVTTYQYDQLDRQTFVGFETTGTPPTYASTMATTYDAGDRAIEIVDSVGGTIERTYDLLDRLTEEVTPEGTVSYTFDDAGRRTSMTVAGQTAVTYSYDDADRLTGVTQGTASVVIAYDNASRRTALTLPNGIVVEYGYDDDSRLTSLTYKQGGNTLGDLTYTYDAAGQRTGVGGTYARTGLPAALVSAAYDDANQIATWESTAFTYDDNGNLTSDGVRTYTWDARNQLASLAGPVSASFGYNGLGRRRTKTVGSTTTEFLYDGLNPVQELSGGNVVANLLTGLGIDEYFTRTDAAGVRNFLTDALGSTVALADGTGVVHTEYSYEPFGGSSTGGISTANTFAFTGREADGTGLYFYRARYYDPHRQRFIGEDPLGIDAGDTNLHAYVGNQPTGRTDPIGLQYFDINATGILPNSWGVTGGQMMGPCGGQYPYLGPAWGTPGVGLTGTVGPTSSAGPGVNVSAQVSLPIGPGRIFVGQVGYGWSGGWFWEVGAGVGTPGASASAFYAWTGKKGCDDGDGDDNGDGSGGKGGRGKGGGAGGGGGRGGGFPPASGTAGRKDKS